MVRAGDLSLQDRLGFHRQRLSRVRHPRGAAPRHPPACAPRPHHLPPRWASGEATGVGGSAQGAAAAARAHRDSPLESEPEGGRTSARLTRAASQDSAAAGHPRTAWEAGVYGKSPLAQAEPPSPAEEGSCAQHTEFPSPVGGALRDQWEAESPRATAPQAG